MLHLVNKSPFEKSALESCLRLAQPGSSILLLEDGVYAALRQTVLAGKMSDRSENFSWFVLGPDLDARGLRSAPLIHGIQIVDYEGFVDLVAEHEASHSWL